MIINVILEKRPLIVQFCTQCWTNGEMDEPIIRWLVNLGKKEKIRDQEMLLLTRLIVHSSQVYFEGANQNTSYELMMKDLREDITVNPTASSLRKFCEMGLNTSKRFLDICLSFSLCTIMLGHQTHKTIKGIQWSYFYFLLAHFQLILSWRMLIKFWWLKCF